MSVRAILRRAGTAGLRALTARSIDIVCDSDDLDLLKYKDRNGTVRTLVNTDNVQTLSNKTLALAAGAAVLCKRVQFTEDATSLTHTATVALPANATLLDIIVSAGVLWGAAAAVLKVGDTADDDGYFIGVDLKATDLLVGEVLSVSGSTGNWGGKNGAYLVAATGRRGPAATNFGAHYTAGSNITGIVTVTTPAVTTGRTYMDVFYSVGDAVAPVLA